MVFNFIVIIYLYESFFCLFVILVKYKEKNQNSNTATPTAISSNGCRKR